VTSYKSGPSGLCVHCGRPVGWHGGTRCYGPKAKGMPKGISKKKLQEWHNAALFLKGE
jgi:hypothetical protein